MSCRLTKKNSDEERLGLSPLLLNHPQLNQVKTEVKTLETLFHPESTELNLLRCSTRQTWLPLTGAALNIFFFQRNKCMAVCLNSAKLLGVTKPNDDNNDVKHTVTWHKVHTTFDPNHYCDVTMGAVASQITSPTIGHSTVHSGTDQRRH